MAAVHTFLAEAVAVTVRRPYEALEQVILLAFAALPVVPCLASLSSCHVMATHIPDTLQPVTHPHALHAQVQELLGEEELMRLRDAGVGAGFSGLAVTALRRVLRVAASAKMAPEAKTAVAAYVSSTPLYVHKSHKITRPRDSCEPPADSGGAGDSHPNTSCRAGVLLSVLRMQTCAAPFAMVCRRILESSEFLGGEGTSDATVAELAPSVVQPLVSLHQHALAALGEQFLGSHLRLGFPRAVHCSCPVCSLDPRQGFSVSAGMQHVKDARNRLWCCRAQQ